MATCKKCGFDFAPSDLSPSGLCEVCEEDLEEYGDEYDEHDEEEEDDGE